MSSSNIDYIGKLEALQETVPSLEDLVSDMHGTFVQYEMEKGFSVGNALLHDHDCAVQKLFIAENSQFPTHVHDEYEYLIVIDGEGDFIVNGELKHFKPKDCIIILPGQVHSFTYKTHSIMLIATIPASKGFPHDQG